MGFQINHTHTEDKMAESIEGMYYAAMEYAEIAIAAMRYLGQEIEKSRQQDPNKTEKAMQATDLTEIDRTGLLWFANHTQEDPFYDDLTTGLFHLKEMANARREQTLG
jgi:hypothetical protein